MANHTKALIPIEAWAYNSPALYAYGKSIDVGLLAESLIYYEQIFLNIYTEHQWAELLTWLLRTRQFYAFCDLLKDGTITIYDYSFAPAAANMGDKVILVNIQDPIQAKQGSYVARLMHRPEVQTSLHSVRQRKLLLDVLRGRVREVKAAAFGPSIQNALADCLDPRRSAIIVQAMVDELYRFRGLGHPPEIDATIVPVDGTTKHNVTWSINLEELSKTVKVPIALTAPLTASAICNQFLWSAAEEQCDLFVGQPMSTLIGDKLYETVRTSGKSEEIINELKDRVEFPDVRHLVNSEVLSLEHVLKIRAKSGRFRSWLQSESDRDRDAIVAYHSEIGKECGYRQTGAKILNIFGILGGGTLGAAVGTTIGGISGSAIGGAVGASGTYLAQLASQLLVGWKPVVFGEWMRTRISKFCE